MGKIQIFTREQKIVLDEVRKNQYLHTRFYFTGGTALSAFYLKHRYSDDLDFFTEETFDKTTVIRIFSTWAKLHSFTFRTRSSEYVIFVYLRFKNGAVLKVDFARYPYKQLEPPKQFQGIVTDSLFDIAVNKLSTVSSRIEVKDYVDLYYLFHTFSLWDLIEGVRVKFNMEIEPFLLASDFIRAETFTFLPQMIRKLNLPTLKSFFRNQAQTIGKKAVKS